MISVGSEATVEREESGGTKCLLGFTLKSGELWDECPLN